MKRWQGGRWQYMMTGVDTKSPLAFSHGLVAADAASWSTIGDGRYECVGFVGSCGRNKCNRTSVLSPKVWHFQPPYSEFSIMKRARFTKICEH